MRRVVVALLFAVVASTRFASAAAISVAGAECGSDPLLGLTFTIATTGNTSCPGAFGSILDSSGDPAYGDPITSIDFTIVNGTLNPDDLTVGENSALPDLTFTDSGFQLSGGEIPVGCFFTTTDVGFCITDVLITFPNTEGLTSDTIFKVTAVNGITAVPEPATGALLLAGLSAAFVRRRARRRRE
jgi:hypothetical protein